MKRWHVGSGGGELTLAGVESLLAMRIYGGGDKMANPSSEAKELQEQGRRKEDEAHRAKWRRGLRVNSPLPFLYLCLFDLVFEVPMGFGGPYSARLSLVIKIVRHYSLKGIVAINS